MKLWPIQHECAHTSLHMCPEISTTLILRASQWSFPQTKKKQKKVNFNACPRLYLIIDVGSIGRSSDFSILKHLITVYDVFLHTL